MESLEVLKSKVAVFNNWYLVGSLVVVIKDLVERLETKVRSAAQVLGGHTAVLWVEGISGAYSLNRVVPWLVSK